MSEQMAHEENYRNTERSRNLDSRLPQSVARVISQTIDPRRDTSRIVRFSFHGNGTESLVALILFNGTLSMFTSRI